MNRRLNVSLLLILACAFVLDAQVLTSSNLPILVINTKNGASIPNEPKIDAQLGIIWNYDRAANSIHSPFNHFDGKIGIEVRGSSSQSFEKKGYAVETRKADGSTLNVSLLGFPAENDWVLHGPYSDKSLMRNAVAYTLAGWIMDYAPRVRFVEVILNGNYIGVYLFTEKIKRDANRVPIADLLPTENSGDDLTGGYILKIDKWDGANNAGFPSQYKPYLGSKSTTTFQYHYPKPEDITAAQKAYIQKYINELELVLQSPGFKEPTTGYRKYFDLPSFMQMIFVQEMSKNVDGYRLSTFMYKNKESINNKLYMGPVWDFNLGFGNANYCDGAPTTGWAFNFNNICPGDSWEVHFWWDRMRQDEKFNQDMAKYWFELRAEKLNNQRIGGLIDSLAFMLDVPASRNFTRWNVLSKWVWPNAYVGNAYSNEVSYMRSWLIARLAWMDAAFQQMTPVDTLPGDSKEAFVFPNPFSDELTFKFLNPEKGPVRFELYSMDGKILHQITEEGLPGGIVEKSIQVKVPKGLYIYRIWLSNETSYRGKVVKS